LVQVQPQEEEEEPLNGQDAQGGPEPCGRCAAPSEGALGALVVAHGGRLRELVQAPVQGEGGDELQREDATACCSAGHGQRDKGRGGQ